MYRSALLSRGAKRPRKPHPTRSRFWPRLEPLEGRLVPAFLALSWEGTMSTAWAVAKNWKDTATGNPPAFAPDLTDNVTIPAGKPDCVVTGQADAGSVTNQGKLVVQGSLTTLGGVSNSSTLILTGKVVPHTGLTNTGTLEVQGSGVVGGDLTNNGTAYLHGLPLDLASDIGGLIVSGNYSQGSSANLNLRVDPLGISELIISGSATLAGNLNISPFLNPTPPRTLEYQPVMYGSRTGNGTFLQHSWSWGKFKYNDDYLTDPEALILKVPPISGSGAINVVEGTKVATVATFTDPGYITAPPPGNYTAQIYYGDNTEPDPGQVTGSGGNYTVGPAPGFEHAYKKDGSYDVKILINDTGGPGVFQLSATATITEAPLSSSGIPFNGRAGMLAPTPPAAIASFTDGNSAAQDGDFKATVTWGDTPLNPNISPEPAVVQHVSGGSFQVVASHDYAAAGTYFFTVRIDEVEGGATTVATGTATISSSLLDEALAAVDGAVGPVIADASSSLVTPTAPSTALPLSDSLTSAPIAVGGSDSPVPAQAAPAAPPVTSTDSLAVDALFEELAVA